MRFLLYTLSAFVLVVMAGLVAVFLVVAKYGRDLPDYHQLANYDPKITTRIHAGDGQLLAEFATEKRSFVPYEAIPKRVVNAFLAAEDKDFFKHGGIDPVRMARAIIKDLTHMHEGKRPEGASTITQQVAKNFLLTNEVSLSRKIKEAILAYRIEETFSKERILELYLNQIYLGQGTYGVAAASLNYFDKPLDQLSIAQAAFLGELPKAPNNFNPDRRTDAALERRDWVIGRMAEDGFISADEATTAQAEPLGIQHGHETDAVTANYFTEEVRKQLAEKFGEEGLYGGGLSVRTSLDTKLQGQAVKALRDGLVAYDERHGWRGVVAHIATGTGWDKRFAAFPLPDGAEAWQKALVLQSGKEATLQLADGSHVTLTEAGFKWTHHSAASQLMNPGDIVLVEQVTQTVEAAPPRKNKKGKPVELTPTPATETHWELRQLPAVNGAMMAMDPHTGRVLAMVGGLSTAANQFNRATQAQRQPGSSFKPFVYMAALDKGFTPSTIVLDGPISLPQGPGLPLWQPVNYEHDFLGPQPLRVGVEKSRNAMTVRIAEYIGMPAVVDMAEKFGVLDNPPVNFSLAIGSGETTLMRMVTAYSMIVNGGMRIQPTLVDRIQDRNGKTVYRHDARACPDCTGIAWADQTVPVPQGQVEQVEDPRTAFQMTNIMEGVVQRGTASQLNKLPWPLAGKTGTTNESKDVWFIGFTPDLTVGVFVGYDQPKSLGKHETGASTAVPIFGQFMKAALADKPPTPFRTPPGVRMVRVNPATGQPDFGAANGIWEAFIPGNEPGDPGFIATGAALAAKLNGTAPVDSDAQGGAEAMPANLEGANASEGEDSASAASDSQDTMPLGTSQPVPSSGPQPPSQQAAPASSAGEGTGGLY